MHSYETHWHLGMPHTVARAIGEVALLAHAQDLHWKEMGRLTGCPATRMRDGEGREVYASIFYVDLEAPAERGLAAFGPDDDLVVDGTLGRYGPSILDGTHRLTLPGSAASIALRMSFVLVGLNRGPEDLRVTTPANASMTGIPSLDREPDSYRIVRAAGASKTLAEPASGAVPLLGTPVSRSYPIDPDRDINGVGLLYFANYVAFLVAAERDALADGGSASALPARRVTVRRRIAYYGNALSTDRLTVVTEADALDGPPATRIHVRQRIHRASDDRLIALASAERRVLAGDS